MADVASYAQSTGPMNFVVVEFPDGRIVDTGFASLRAAVEGGTVLILDVEFISVDGTGHSRSLDASDVLVDQDAALAWFSGASSGLLEDDDIAEVASRMSPGSLGAVVVYEDRSLIAALEDWERDGAIVVAEGPILPDDLETALDHTDERKG
ncbi:hypothetical protein ACPPVQ_15630 [Diaminobutyricibacter sp. McL0618]|uniref:hypothetical protein n=1 Tax=Leifsonia sp. McL0618 TaxID=3415677 RepID=UPI003CF5D809